MLDYIWIHEKSPILKQIPNNFKSAAILLHPFVQMPSGWGKSRSKRKYELHYQIDEKLLNIGNPIKWKEIISYSDINSYKELAIALKSSIGSLKTEYERIDLTNKLNSILNPDMCYPSEDSTSVFLLDSLLKILSSKGAKNLYFSDPILSTNGLLNTQFTNSIDICKLSGTELIVTDENLDFAFMSLYDSFTTLLLAKDDNIEHIVHSMNYEALICDQKTLIDWYL